MGARIVIADEAGACFGVERALKMVRRATESSAGPVKTLGPLIHNPVVVDELKTLGVEVATSAAQEPGVTLVLRTHGVKPEVEREAKESGATVIDATCPFVKVTHKAVERLSCEGYQVLIVGESGHPEVEATLAHAPDAIVVGSANEVERLPIGLKVGIVVQTTQSLSRLREVVSALVGRVDELRVMNTICSATASRQRAAASVSKTSDVMVVIGGRNSANTRRLVEICSSNCEKTYHVESDDELEEAWFDGASVIGITAGASTPREHIERVSNAIAALVESE